MHQSAAKFDGRGDGWYRREEVIMRRTLVRIIVAAVILPLASPLGWAI